MTYPSTIPKARYMTMRDFHYPNERENVIDSVMLAYFPAPNSYTGEDVVELYVHGSRAVIQSFDW